MRATPASVLERAQELLQASITLIEEATEGDANTKAYLVDQLKTMASNDHGFLCSNLNLDKVIQKYEDRGYMEFSDEVESIMEGDF